MLQVHTLQLQKTSKGQRTELGNNRFTTNQFHIFSQNHVTDFHDLTQNVIA